MGKSLSIKNAVVTLMSEVEYKGEPAFANVTDDTASDFAEYPVLRVLPNFIENTRDAQSQNDRDVNLQLVVTLPLEDPAAIQAKVIDQIYDLTDLILDTLDSGDFNDRLKEIDPTIGSYDLVADRADWDVVDTKGGAQLMLIVGIVVSYVLDLETVD